MPARRTRATWRSASAPVSLRWAAWSSSFPPRGPASEASGSQPAEEPDLRETPAEAERRVEQARHLKALAREGGLRFSAYLPPGLAEWVLDLVERGVFLDPSEAVFVILSEHRDLAPHADLRRELLRRRVQAAIDDPRPPVAAEEVFAELEETLARGLPEPAEWRKVGDER